MDKFVEKKFEVQECKHTSDPGAAYKEMEEEKQKIHTMDKEEIKIAVKNEFENDTNEMRNLRALKPMSRSALNVQITTRFALTLGEQAEIRAGCPKLGNKLADYGFTVQELQGFKSALGAHADLHLLHKSLKKEKDRENPSNAAAVLVIRNGINLLMQDPYYSTKMLYEQKKTPYDEYKQGNVSLGSRHGAVFGDVGRAHSKDYVESTIVAFDQVPYFQRFRQVLPRFFGEKTRLPGNKLLFGEGNHYLDMKSGIHFHGDTERKIVICCSLGRAMPLRFRWKVPYAPRHSFASEPIDIQLTHGDVYIMSEKATGNDWNTARLFVVHTAGSPDHLNPQPKNSYNM
jgi:hypothetical protein